MTQQKLDTIYGCSLLCFSMTRCKSKYIGLFSLARGINSDSPVCKGTRTFLLVSRIVVEITLILCIVMNCKAAILVLLDFEPNIKIKKQTYLEILLTANIFESGPMPTP